MMSSGEIPGFSTYYQADQPAALPSWRWNLPVTGVAQIQGGPLAPQISGVVWFFDVPGGSCVYVDVNGLPLYQPASDGKPPVGPHGFHIHESGNCEPGDVGKPFPATGGHWNPTNQPHGNHPGDFPVLFSNNGRARMCFFTDKFKPANIMICSPLSRHLK